MLTQTLAVSTLAVATLSAPPEATTPTRKVSRFAEINAKALAEGTVVQFQHPTTFAEFYEQEPHYIRNWLRFKKCPGELFEDFEQSLFYHMMRPVTNPDTGEVVSQDRLAHYRRDRMGNFGTRWAWAAYINNCLQNEYGKLIKRNNRGFVRGDNVISLTEDGFGEEGGFWLGDTRELPLLLARDSGDRSKFMSHPVDVPTRVFMERFFQHVQEVKGQDHVNVLRAMMATDTPAEAEALTGMTRSQLNRFRSELKVVAQEFTRVRRGRRG